MGRLWYTGVAASASSFDQPAAVRRTRAPPATGAVGATTVAWVPSAYATVDRSVDVKPDRYDATTSTRLKTATPSSGTTALYRCPSSAPEMPLTVTPVRGSPLRV